MYLQQKMECHHPRARGFRYKLPKNTFFRAMALIGGFKSIPVETQIVSLSHARDMLIILSFTFH